MFFPVSGIPPQYTVFEFENPPVDFLTSEFKIEAKRYDPEYSGVLSFIEKEKDISFESAFDESLAGHLKNKKEPIPVIPIEYYPKWESAYLTEINNNRAEMLYFPDTLILIVYIKGH